MLEITEEAITAAMAYLLGEVGVHVTATSGSANDINIAIGYIVMNGGIGTVHVPEGIFNFYEAGDTWKPVFVPIGINIIGALPTGSDSLGIPTGWTTIIKQGIYVSGNESGGIQAWFQLGRSSIDEYFSWYDCPDPLGPVDPSRWVKPIRFANIMLDGWRTDYPLSGAETYGLVITGVINFRVDHCNFKNIAGGAIITHMWYQSGKHCCGVIDHNKIWNTNGISNNANYLLGNVGYGITVGRMYYPDCPVYDPVMDLLGKYFSYAVYIENNYFSKWRHDIASGHGSWYVARYNLFEDDFDQVTVDMHGERDVGDYAGSRGGEIYENTFLNCTYYGDDDNPSGLKGIGSIRGGSGVFFNNYVDNTYTRIFLDEYDYVQEEIWKMKDWCFWSAKGPLSNPEIAVILNYNPFTYDPANNNYLDWARQAGTPSDVNYPNVDPSWSIAGYKPYTYPHPLTLGEPPPPPPPPPENVTPWVVKLNEGTYIITVPEEALSEGKKYRFVQWEDGSTSPTRTITLDSDLTVSATYEVVSVTLQVRAVTDDTEVSASVEVVGVGIQTTPFSLELEYGTYTVIAPSSVKVGEQLHTFESWEDGSTNPERSIELTSDMVITARYKPPTPVPPEKGLLEIHAFFGEEEVEGNGRIIETRETFATPTTIELSPATYTIYCRYRARSKIETVEVVAGATLRVDFQFRLPKRLSKTLPNVGKIYGFPILSRVEDLKRRRG